jgi:uncharacterized protein (UPF0335 family)
MAKRLKPADGGNGFSADLVKSLVDRIEALHGEIESEQAKYMVAAKALREDIANVYEEAGARGVSTKPLKALIKTRKLDRRAKAEKEKLDLDERATLEMLKDALGDLADTPLGEAAVGRAGGKKSQGISGEELAKQVGDAFAN